MHRTSLIAANTASNPLLLTSVTAYLEERKSFGDRRKMPHFEHLHGHPITDRRVSDERRHNYLHKEIFNRHS